MGLRGAHLARVRLTLNHQAADTTSAARMAPPMAAPATQAGPHSGCLRLGMAADPSAACASSPPAQYPNLAFASSPLLIGTHARVLPHVSSSPDFACSALCLSANLLPFLRCIALAVAVMDSYGSIQ